MYKYIITLLMLCCPILPVLADEVKLQPHHPDRYVVVKGDTLWGIAGRFLKDPWQWPQVWKMNREQIKNPHLIYPGDVVMLDMSSGSPQLRLLRETVANPEVTLTPGIRTEQLDVEAIPTISPRIIAPFLSQPLIIENDGLKDAPRIIAGPENRVVLSPGSRIYVDKIDEGEGTLWNIYRTGKTYIDPETKAVLGTEAIYLGDARISKYGEPASGDIVSAKEEIFANDKLVAAPESLQTNFVPQAPEDDVQGRILSIYGGVAEAGRNTIIAISKGSDDGLEQGHVLAINRNGRVIKNPGYDKKNKKGSENIKLPNERIGLAMVFRTFDKISYALIMQATEPVNVLDVVEKP
ncbi:LysM peptidoglycan-binding domain-containing protein [Methylobacillus flagellatus]|uniref:Peptidoglycan-binding LysM n=1 Tax=Methylobacillus flagellatus (strain ATCC 51484 / DSM 6875 / VKM B-1610 / KT) TaxID=265072 RepID=Q1H4X8_METFK|nr:LysM peptidoglycan-binding domain-containing protein [Methylobacillus flagellatus]ABE48459.1 Peptidoglycan-binding LysM [Methylobacillus flagellatus KT]